MARMDRRSVLVAVTVALGLVGPPLGYWALFRSVPCVSPEETRTLLAEQREQAVLVDVRTASEYERFHAPEAISIPLALIRAEPQGRWHDLLRGRAHVLAICNSGLMSAQATRTLRALGVAGARNVIGGLEAWRTGDRVAGTGHDAAMQERNTLPRLELSLLAQATISGAAFGLKPLYMLLSLVLVAMLWSSQETDLVALRRGMLAFFLGEGACAVNYLAFGERSVLMEYLHVYGMMLCFGLTAYAAMSIADRRIIHYSEASRPCALLSICRLCYKHQPVACNLRLAFLFAIPATAIVALMPMAGPLGSTFYVGRVFGSQVIFGHFMHQQMLEARLAPVVSIGIFALAFILLLVGGEKALDSSKIVYAMGLGPLTLSLMRFFSFWAYARIPLWADAWEEILEFLFIAFIMWIAIRLRQVARATLARRVEVQPAEADAAPA